uniref:Rho-GAP domain-containing protein n=1 Tax=Panagrellus redivivus TaxID=6233 RepID=A0A7E4W599_PANRE
MNRGLDYTKRTTRHSSHFYPDALEWLNRPSSEVLISATDQNANEGAANKRTVLRSQSVDAASVLSGRTTTDLEVSSVFGKRSFIHGFHSVKQRGLFSYDLTKFNVTSDLATSAMSSAMSRLPNSFQRLSLRSPSENKSIDLCHVLNGVQKCIEFIEKNDSLQHPISHLIYRHSAKSLTISELQKQFYTSFGIDFENSSLTVTDVAVLLKQVFWNLPAPIVPIVLRAKLIKTLKDANKVALSWDLNSLYKTLTANHVNGVVKLFQEGLSTENKMILHCFMMHLNRVAQNVKTTGMDSSSLAKIVTPSLFHSTYSTISTENTYDYQIQILLTVIMIEHCEFMFNV